VFPDADHRHFILQPGHASAQIIRAILPWLFKVSGFKQAGFSSGLFLFLPGLDFPA
jgi:hypothetical protein